MLNSILDGGTTVSAFLICAAVSLVLGLGTAFISMYKSKCTQSFAVTLAVLPAIVQVVIMLVNGNIGAGVAVAGTFSLVRFRSAPGTAKEIGVIFLAMTIGLATGMGYLLLAAVLFAIVALTLLLLTKLGFSKESQEERILKVTIPENLDYDGLLDDLLDSYTKSWSPERVKTTNMGTLYELQYRVALSGGVMPKELFDEIRCRNGNLGIVCGRENQMETL